MFPDQPRDPDDHEAHSDVSGGLASRVLLDRAHGTATKEYRPPFLVKALYWLAFPVVNNRPTPEPRSSTATFSFAGIPAHAARLDIMGSYRT